MMHVHLNIFKIHDVVKRGLQNCENKVVIIYKHIIIFTNTAEHKKRSKHEFGH